jgi:DNA-binding transcriptional LysR family regulator
MQADLIAYKIKKLEYSYYASSDYVANRGLPKSSFEYNEHRWVMPSGNKRKISFIKDMNQMIEQKNIAYQSNHFFDIQSAVEHGIGIGPIDDAKVTIKSGLQKVDSIVCNNENYLWFVYHKDLRDDLKIKVVAQLIKAQTQCETASTLRLLDEA